MLISKFDLYRHGWLELVFDDRNKEYGAYELRKNYARNVVRAMNITFLVLAALCGASVIFKSPPPSTERLVPVDNTIHELQLKEIKKPDQPHLPKPLRTEPVQKPAQTIRDLPMVVRQDNVADKPVKTTDLIDKTIGQVTSLTGSKGPTVDLPVDNTGGGSTPVANVPDNSVHPAFGLDRMPEPDGGLNGWAKFLSKNLRFPPAAQDEGASGKVVLSFIVEKDGSLSSIIVERPAGHGFDEEALRVLKLAKAWKPGIQNGLPVRVKYNIPINFQAVEQ